MRFHNARTIAASSMAVLLLSSFMVVVGGGTSNAEAQEISSSEVSAASGSNRFVVWTDATPGNGETFFRRSTDNGASWQPFVNLSNNPGDSGSPQIAVSGSNVYVIWFQESADGTSQDVFFRRSTDNGATWGAKVNLSSSGTASANSEIAASDNSVFVLWHDSGFSGGDIFIRRSTNYGAMWNTKVNLSNNYSKSISPDLAVFGSNVFVAWSNWGGPGEMEILVRRSTDGGATWKVKENISQNPGRSSDPEIATFASSVYIAWVDGMCLSTHENCDILFRGSANNGATWTPVNNLSNTAEISITPQFAVSGSNVFLVWEDKLVGDGKDLIGGGEIYFRRSTDGGATWKPIINLSNNPGWSSAPHIAISSSHVHVVWNQLNEEQTASDSFFRRSTDSGATWKPKVNLSNTGDGRGPQVSASGTSVYAVWVDFPGNLEVFFKRSTNDGATWESAKNLSNNSGGSALPQIGL